MKKVAIPLLSCAVLASTTALHADTFNLAQSGSWEASSSWTKTAGSGSQTSPGATDDLLLEGLAGTRTVTYNAETFVQNFHFNDTATVVVTTAGGGVKVLNISGDLLKEGNGMLQFRNGSGTNTRVAIAGDLIINGGTVGIGNASTATSLLTVSGTTRINSGTLELRVSGGTNAGSPISLGNVAIGATGVLNLQLNSVAPFTPQYFRMTGLEGEGVVKASVNADYNATLLLEMGSDSAFNGQIIQEGSGSVIHLRKSGTGVLTLGGSNSFSGVTDIYDGAVSVSSIGSVSQAGNLGTTGAINVGSNATAGRLIYTGSGETTYRSFALSGKTGGGVFQADGIGALKIAGALAATGAGKKTLELTGGSTADNEISSMISDNSATNTTAILKTGSGRWILSGANSYSGATIVSGGMLEAAHSEAFGTGNVVVATGANVLIRNDITLNSGFELDGGVLFVNGTLGGSKAAIGFTASGGTIKGNGTVDAAVDLSHVSQAVAPGETVGSLYFAGDQSWSSFTYDWKIASWTDDAGLAGEAYDQIEVGGTLDLSSTTEFILSISSFLEVGDFAESDRSWIIMKAGELVSFDATLWTIVTDGGAMPMQGAWSLSADGSDLRLNYTAIPEQETWFLLWVGLAGLFAFNRFHRGLSFPCVSRKQV